MLKPIRFIIPGKISVKLLFPLLLILFLTGASPERSLRVENIDGVPYVSLYSLINTLGIENSFDPVFQKGRLFYRSHYLVYKTGYSCSIIDNRLITDSSPVIRVKGAIYIPSTLAISVVETFFTNIKVEEKRNKIVLSEVVPREKEEKKVIIPEKKGKIAFIIIDPGHGGKDPGAIGKGGSKEKTITLQISKKVEMMLKKRLEGIKIKITRKDDRFIELAERAEIANRELRRDVNGIFVSIHVNASISSRISGFETYFLSQNPTNEEARKTATLENNVIVLENDYNGKKRYDDVDYMEAMMMTTQIQKESSMLAEAVQRSMDKNISEFKSRGVHRADFYVLRGALMPAVLAEVGFITHQKESTCLKRENYQEKIASGICDGILNFISQYNKMIE